jgi:peptidoglycan hydrolase CwlO-like protein
MKRLAVILMAGMFLVSALPVAAQTTKSEKDQCILASMNCKSEVDTLQQSVKKIQSEIKKGTKVYTPEELKALETKLKEVNDFIKTMGKPGK